MKRALVSSVLLGAILAFAVPARADEEQRQRLIEKLHQALADKEHAHALELALEAAAIRASSSLLRAISEEHIELAHLPEAYDAARRCVRLADREPPSSNRDAVRAGCRAILDDLGSKLALITVVPVRPEPHELRIAVNGKPRDAAEGPVPVMPGQLRVDGGALGWRPFALTSDVRAGAELSVRIALERDAPAQIPDRAPRSRSLVGPILIGAGVAALAGGGVLRLVANGKYDDARSACARGPCPDGSADRSSVDRLDTISLVSAIGGVGLVALGATLFVLDGHKPDAAPRAAARLRVGPAYLGLAGEF